jgi:hypothetical protein
MVIISFFLGGGEAPVASIFTTEINYTRLYVVSPESHNCPESHEDAHSLNLSGVTGSSVSYNLPMISVYELDP